MQKFSTYFYGIVLVIIALAAGGWFIMSRGIIPIGATHPQKKPYTIGILARGAEIYDVAVEGYKNELRELGYRVGITFSPRFLGQADQVIGE